MAAELRFVLDDREALEREHVQNFRHGRALVPKICGFAQLDPVTLVLERAWDGGELAIEARVVMILEAGPVVGTALEIGTDEATRRSVEAFVEGARETGAEAFSVVGVGDGDGVGVGVGVGVGDGDGDGVGDGFGDGFGDGVGFGGAVAGALPSLDEGPVEESGEGEALADESGVHVDPKIVRIRHLSMNERAKMARDGHLEDRVLLERVYGKSVWDDLLRNPGITLPEVARIANKGTAPRIMLDVIVDHAAWSRQSIVRRALLGNPRLSPEAVGKLLRATPKGELKLIGQGSAYPIAVRTLAKKIADE